MDLLVPPQPYFGPWRLRLRGHGGEDPGLAAVQAALEPLRADSNRRILLDGPEPTQSPILADAIRAARAVGAEVWMATEARALGLSSRSRMLREAGLSGIETTLPPRSDPAFKATLLGLSVAGSCGLEVVVRWPLSRLPRLNAHALATMLAKVGVNRLVIDVAGMPHDASATLRSLWERERPGSLKVEVEGCAPPLSPAGDATVELDVPLVRLERIGIRSAAARAGIWTSRTDAAAASRALAAHGGLEQAIRMLHATGAAPLDLPACLGGLDREDAAGGLRTKGTGCDRCPRDSECRGAPSSIAPHVALHPRPFWSGIGTGARIVVMPGGAGDNLRTTYMVPGLIDALRAEGAQVMHEEADARELAEADLVLAPDLRTAGDACKARPPRSGRRIIAFDLHCMLGVYDLAARFLPAGRPAGQGGWWPENVVLVSCFPSFAHLYVAAGVPLHAVEWRPYPLDPVLCGGPDEDLDAPRIFAGGSHLRDWSTLQAAAGLLGTEISPIDVYADKESVFPRSGPLVAHGYLDVEGYVRAVKSARFVVVAAESDRDHPAGGSVIGTALALGKCVVATWTPMAHDHLRDGFDSLIVPPRDAGALARAIARVDHDRDLRSRLSAGARQSGGAASVQTLAHDLVHGAPARATWADPITGVAPWRAWPHSR